MAEHYRFSSGLTSLDHEKFTFVLHCFTVEKTGGDFQYIEQGSVRRVKLCAFAAVKACLWSARRYV